MFDSGYETLADAMRYFPCHDLPPHDPSKLKEYFYRSGAISTTWLANRYMGHMKKLHKDSYMFNHAVEEEYAIVFLFYAVGNCIFKARDSAIRFRWITCVIADNMKDLDFGVQFTPTWYVTWMLRYAQLILKASGI